MKLPLQVNVGRSKRVRLLVYHNDDCKKARSEKTERATIFFYFILSFIFVFELYEAHDRRQYHVRSALVHFDV